MIKTVIPEGNAKCLFLLFFLFVAVFKNICLPAQTPGFYKDLFMDGGIELTSRTVLPAANALGLTMEYLATEDHLVQTSILIQNNSDDNGVLLYPDGFPRFRLIYTNGGSATGHGNSLGEKGRARVRAFYYNGSSYSGSCAGAFIASVSYMYSGTYEPYYHIWPGRTQTTGLEATNTGQFIPTDSPLLDYFGFGDDLYISSVYHNGGCFARETVNYPSNTEVLLRYDYPTLEMHNKPSCWAYKKNDQSGRLVVIGSHPESVTSGEKLELMKAIFFYALDGLGNPHIKGELLNGQYREMDKSTEENDPDYTMIGDRQYHHFMVVIPENAENLSVQLDGDDNFNLELYLNKDSLAFQSVAEYQGTGTEANKDIILTNPSPGIWYVAVECRTTVQTILRSWGYDYSGQIAVLNGVAYTLAVNWDINSNILANSDHLEEYSLYQNYPNPFNPTTTIRYDIPEASNVILTIYNMNGQVIERLIDQKQEPGSYSVNWNAWNKISGMYLYRIQAGRFQQVKKMLLIK